MDARETFAHVKQVMTASARESILAVDQTKFDRKAFARITGIRNLTTVITDEEPSGDWQRIFSQKDIRCMYPEKSGRLPAFLPGSDSLVFFIDLDKIAEIIEAPQL